jgi:hypothetical protein
LDFFYSLNVALERHETETAMRFVGTVQGRGHIATVQACQRSDWDAVAVQGNK